MSDRLEVIYSVQHTCGETLWLSDHRIHNEEGVAQLRSGQLPPKKVYCTNCQQEAVPEGLSIIGFRGLSAYTMVSEMPLGEFLVGSLPLQT
jgi:hypothetical protein